MDHSLFTLCKTLLKTFQSGIGNWGILHPSIVHIPIGLLCAVPVLLLLAILLKSTAKQYLIATLAVLIIGTGGLFLAVFTGEHAAEALKPNPAVYDTLEHHEDLAEDARLSFCILTGLFAVYVIFYSRRKEKLNPQQHLAVQILFLCFACYGLLLLLNAAHMGGKLVHYYGLKTPMYSGQSPD